MDYLCFTNNIKIISQPVCNHYVHKGSLVTRKKDATELHEIYMKKYESYRNVYDSQNIFEENKSIVATKLLYTYLILSQIYQKQYGTIRKLLKQINTKENRKVVKIAENRNWNYRIFKFLFVLRLKEILILYTKLKNI